MILDEILESKQAEADRLRSRRESLERRAAAAGEVRDFGSALSGGDRVAVVAEFKRRSPSAGDLALGADPAEVGRGYAEGGAAALSVLTDERWFGGRLDDLSAARDASGLPVLRKDFVVDPIQLVEARAAGADAVLLIVRALCEDALAELLGEAGRLGLHALVEAHTEAEVDRAVDAGARIVGVNARDLSSFAVDLSLSERLLGRIPPDRVAVAESGVRGEADVERVAAAGADAVLVGGWLMDAGHEAVARLVDVPRARRGGRR